MINELVDLMVSEGMIVENLRSTIESLTESIASGHIRALYKNDTPIGFFAWREISKNNKLYIWISYLCVKKQYRDKSNLLALRKFFRKEYPVFEFAYWKQDKDGHYFYAR